jgi:tetratricopeptide (TPR) repeat protein
MIPAQSEEASEELSILELWEQRKYDELILLSRNILNRKPMDDTALVLAGFAHFYKGVAQVSLEEQLPYIDSSVTYLRKANLVSSLPEKLEAEIHYVLGKAYFHKGRYYTDLAIHYLEKALEMGYTNEDIHEHLGVAYSRIEDHERSIHYFLEALERNPSDILYYTLGQVYFQTNRPRETEEYLLKALDTSRDVNVQQKSRMLLGRLYFQREEYVRAKEQYEKILEVNDQSADAHFHLGEIYEELDNTAKARAEWRRALQIDPSHYGARLKLYR